MTALETASVFPLRVESMKNYFCLDVVAQTKESN